MINIPNWCENKLVVTGPREELAKFATMGRGKSSFLEDSGEEVSLSCNSFVPMPKELEGTQSPPDETKPNLIKKYGADNWYDWHLRNWGSKWDLSNVTINTNIFHVNPKGNNKKVRRLMYGFDTAWSPPEPFIAKVGEMFPQLKFKLEYWESGMAFSGVFIVKNGQIIKNETYNYSGKRGG